MEEMQTVNEYAISKARLEDLQEILNLQYLAYQSEAALLDNYDIPPLKQTLDEMIGEYHKGIILKMVDAGGLIIGSIRAWEMKGTVHVGKLMVHPDYRHHGYGTKLLGEIEKHCPQKRYELFTSTRSIDNIRLYQRMGYQVFDHRLVDDKLEFVYLEKNASMMAQATYECMSNWNQMQLRPFNANDAATILSWCKDKHAFQLWSADRYKDFPAKPEEMVRQYDGQNMHPLMAIVDGIIIGHILLRYPSEEKTVIRFGFVIVDDSKRGKGYGKQMLRLAIDYAQQELRAKCITLGVFCDNNSAVECYKSVGFRIIGKDSYAIDGEDWESYEMKLDK